MNALRLLVFRGLIKRDASITIKYESLCDDPQKVLNEVFEFLSLEVQNVLINIGSESEVHNIGGSPHRFTFNSSDISLDEKWLKELTKNEQKKLTRKIGVFNKILGYKN